MTEIRRCPFLDSKTGLCTAIGQKLFSWPSQASFHTGGGFCLAKNDLAKQGSCSHHPQHKQIEEEKSIKDQGSN